MTQMQSPLFLITGAPGARQSVTAAALMRRFPFGLHIPVDDLREWVVSGISHPLPEFTDGNRPPVSSGTHCGGAGRCASTWTRASRWRLTM